MPWSLESVSAGRLPVPQVPGTLWGTSTSYGWLMIPGVFGVVRKGGVVDIEMEFAVELRADAKAKAGFKAWVLASAEVEAGVSRGRTHRVMVTLTPKRPDGGDLLIAAEPDGPAGPGDVSGHVGR